MVILSLLWLSFMGVFYYGLFPVLFLSQHLKKHILTGPLLGVLIIVNIILLTGNSASGNILAIFVATSFVIPSLIIIQGINRQLDPLNIFYLCHLPGVLVACYFLMSPLSHEALAPLLGPMVEKFSSMNAASESGNFDAEYFYHLMSRFMAVFWLTDLSIRLIIGSAILSKIQRSRKINLRIQNLRDIKYPDWPIWIVISGLSGLFLSLYSEGFFPSSLIWLSGAILIIIAPLYFLRGLSVVFSRFHEKKMRRPWPIYLKFLLILLILWAGPTLAIVAILFGTLDTWMDFRKKYTEQPSGR